MTKCPEFYVIDDYDKGKRDTEQQIYVSSAIFTVNYEFDNIFCLSCQSTELYDHLQNVKNTLERVFKHAKKWCKYSCIMLLIMSIIYIAFKYVCQMNTALSELF